MELVWVAQPTARCGEVGSIGRRRLVFQGRVRTLFVVVGDARGESAPGVAEAEEQRLVQELIAHPPVTLSMKALWIGFPGAMKCQSTAWSLHQPSIALLNSEPLSETTAAAPLSPASSRPINGTH